VAISGQSQTVSVEVIARDALTVGAEVLVLKYAQELYGLDRKVAEALPVQLVQRLPGEGEFRLLPGSGLVGARQTCSSASRSCATSAIAKSGCSRTGH
jgi:hypothetical protein